MAIKIDLEKAFNKIEWNFIRLMLNSINLSQSLVSIILSCISSTSLAVLINGKQSNYFEPFWGIRHGDSLSPYLFILDMEFLSMLIYSIGAWKLIQLSKLGPSIFYTLFADDVFLFVEATVENVVSINSVLNFFFYHL